MVRFIGTTVPEKKQELALFLRRADQAPVRGKLVVSLILAAELLRRRGVEEQIVAAIKQLEESGKIVLPPAEYKKVKDLIAENVHNAKLAVRELQHTKEKVQNTFNDLEHYITQVCDSSLVFIEGEDFLWSKSKNSNVQRLERVLKLHFDKRVISDFQRSLHSVNRFIPIDHDFTELLESTRIFSDAVADFNSEIDTLSKMRMMVDNHTVDLSNKERAAKLNKNSGLAFAQFQEMKKGFALFLRLIDEALARQELNLKITGGDISHLEISKLMKQVSLSSSRQKILILVHEFDPTKAGGVMTVVRKLSKYLLKNYDVDVIERSIGMDDMGTFYYYLGATEQKTFAFQDMSGFFSKFPELQFSLLHVESINFAPGAKGWANGGLDELKTMYSGIGTVCTIHSLVRYEATRRNEPWIPYSIMMQDQTINLSNRYIVLHEFGKQQLQFFYPHIKESQIVVIPNGIELHHQSLKVFEGVMKLTSRTFGKTITLLYVGRLSREKGLEELIQALPKIKTRSHQQIRLVIVGPTEGSAQAYYRELLARMEELGLENEKDILFVGSVPGHEQEEKVYQKFKPDFAILPSHHESFPLFALEALSQGVPLIVTDCDGPREVYAPFRVSTSFDGTRAKQSLSDIENPLPGFRLPLAIAVDPGKHESIVEAVLWALDHPREVHVMLQNALKEIRARYNWQAIAEETGKLYDSLIGQKGFISRFDVDAETSLITPEIEETKIKLKNLKIGIIGHFKLANGVCSDGVARWCETMFANLRHSGYNVEGYGFVGASRSSKHDGTVHYYPPKRIADELVKYDIDIAVVRGDAEPAENIINALSKKNIPVLFVMPYWGAWSGTYDIARKVDILFTSTKDYALKLQAKTGRDCRYLPWPIDVDFWKRESSHFIETLKDPRWPKKTFNIVYIGRLGITKKIHRVVEPFYEYIIKKGFKDIRLIICGDSEENMGDLLVAEIERLNMQDYVIYHRRGFSSKEVREIYNSCDIFLFASSFETYGQSNLEAISCGTPTVVPGVNGFSFYAVPSMANLEGYDFSFKTGSLYDETGNMIAEGTPFDWKDCFDKVIWIYQHYQEALKIMEKWSAYVRETMAPDVIGKKFERALIDAYLKKRKS